VRHPPLDGRSVMESAHSAAFAGSHTIMESPDFRRDAFRSQAKVFLLLLDCTNRGLGRMDED
jgi:hypothetical protein